MEQKGTLLLNKKEWLLMVAFELNTPINVFSSRGWQGKRNSTIKVVLEPTEIKVALLSADYTA